METGHILLLTGVILVIAAVLGYNRLVALRNRFRNAYSQIDVQLQRRYELIPNLVETVRAYLKHESETLLAVTTARNTAESCRQEARGSNDALASLATAEQSVAGALGRLNLVMEAYPELKADQRLSELHADIASTENRVAFSRQAYSDAVMHYNTACEQFPIVIIASLFRFREAALFEADNRDAREAVKVSFA